MDNEQPALQTEEYGYTGYEFKRAVRKALGATVALKLRVSGTYTVANITDTRIPWASAESALNKGIQWSASDPTKVYCTQAGIYTVGVYATQSGANVPSAYTNEIKIFVNGSEEGYGVEVTTAAKGTVMSVTTIIALNPGDYVEYVHWQDSGGTRTYGSGSGDQRIRGWIARLDQ